MQVLVAMLLAKVVSLLKMTLQSKAICSSLLVLKIPMVMTLRKVGQALITVTIARI